MCFALFMAMLDNTVVNVALPRIQAPILGPASRACSGSSTPTRSSSPVFMLSGGTLGDIYGRKRFFMLGLSNLHRRLAAVRSRAPSLQTLIAGRAVQGLGAAALLPGTLSILTNTFHDPRERAQAIGIWAGISRPGAGARPAGGRCAGRLLRLAERVLPQRADRHRGHGRGAVREVPRVQEPRGRPSRFARPGHWRSSPWVPSPTRSSRPTTTAGPRPVIISSCSSRPPLAPGAVFLLGRAFADPRPRCYQLAFFRDRTFSTQACGCAGLISFGMFGMFFFMSLFFQNVQGYTAFQAGLRSHARPQAWWSSSGRRSPTHRRAHRLPGCPGHRPGSQRGGHGQLLTEPSTRGTKL